MECIIMHVEMNHHLMDDISGQGSYISLIVQIGLCGRIHTFTKPNQ